MSNIKKETIKVEGKEWKEAIDKAYKKAVNKVKIDGFRKGHAPKDLFIKKYGQITLYYDAANIVVDKAYEEMMTKNKDILMDLIQRPEVAIDSLDEKGVTFNFTLTLKPTVKLGKYKNLDVKKEKAKVSAEEIQEAIDNIRQRYAEDVLKEGKIDKGDTAVIDFDGSVDGNHFEGGKAENYSLKIGSNTFIPGFEDQLIGHKAGDNVEVKVTFPKDYQAKDLAGKDAIFAVKIHEVKEVKIPELNDDFFADLGMENVKTKKELEDQVSDDLLANKNHEIEDKYMDDLLEEAAKNTEVDIPDVMIEDEKNRMLEEARQNIQRQGLTLEMYYKFTNTDEQTLKDQMTDEATKRVKYRLMLEEIAKEEKIKVTKEEIDKYAEEEAKLYNVKKEEFISLIGGNEVVEYDLKMRKALEILKGEEKEDKKETKKTTTKETKKKETKKEEK